MIEPERIGESATLYCGDALEVLGTLEDASVGHIVCDPPYGQTNESYDSPVAFAPEVWRECYRVAGANAALVAFAGSPTYHKIATAVEAGGWKVRQMWGWVYRNGMITSAYPKEGFDRLAPAMDPVVFATKGKILLRLEREGGAWKAWHNRPGVPWSGRSRRSGITAAAGHWPKSIVATEGLDGLQYFCLSHNAVPRDEKVGHPNQKPLALMRWIVAKLPQPGPILDPFAGSATTLIAARDEGFEAVGIERDPDYLDIARRRLRAELDRTPLLATEPAASC